MALYHFHAGVVTRAAGSSAVVSAAYRAGEKLHNAYYGGDADYTHKGGVIYTEIFLPPNAPDEYKDRETLWNAVEKIEKHPRAQLAYSYDFALQNELTIDENIALARRFVEEQFVSKDMVVDFAVHAPDSEKDGIPNPHVHLLCPIRPLNKDGEWDAKQRRVYRVDDHGERIRDEAGNFVFDAVPTTDWGQKETLLHWRAEWANYVNRAFEEKGLSCRIDHRTLEEQGIDRLPTIHEGPAVRAMEKKGITTDKGDFNRWVKITDATLQAIRQKIKDLLAWLKEIKKELSAPREPTLADYLSAYYHGRNAGAWSSKAKVGNLKHFAEAVNYLTEIGIATLEDLEKRVAAHSDLTDAVNSSMKAMSARKKELVDLLHNADLYRETRVVYNEWKGIKWKGKREKFEIEHERDLKVFHMARRKLDKCRTSDGKIPVLAWRQELAEIQQKYQAEYERYKPMRDDLMKLLRVKNCVDTVLRQREQTQERHREVER